jgi:hypothetical protein
MSQTKILNFCAVAPGNAYKQNIISNLVVIWVNCYEKKANY